MLGRQIGAVNPGFRVLQDSIQVYAVFHLKYRYLLLCSAERAMTPNHHHTRDEDSADGDDIDVECDKEED